MMKKSAAKEIYTIDFQFAPLIYSSLMPYDILNFFFYFFIRFQFLPEAIRVEKYGEEEEVKMAYKFAISR